MQVRAAGLVIGLAGLLYVLGFSVPPSRGAEVDPSDAQKPAQSSLYLPGAATERPQPLHPAFVAGPVVLPIHVEPVEVEPAYGPAAAVDRDPTGSLPEKDQVAEPYAAGQDSKLQKKQSQKNQSQELKSQELKSQELKSEARLQDAKPLEPQKLQPDVSSSEPALESPPSAPAAAESHGDEGDRAPVREPESAGSSPERGLRDFIKSAVEALSATQVHGAHAAELGKERAGLAAFYADRDYAPLWIKDGKADEAAQAALAQLAHAEDDGLDLRTFAVPAFEGSDEKLAAADVALSAKVVAYGRQASGSRVDPHQIAALIGAKPDVAEPAVILGKVAEAAEKAGVVLESFNPPQSGYQALREKLAELRRAAVPTAHVTIPAGPDLKIGMRDSRVSLLRSRFGLDAVPTAGSEDLVYDTQVAAAVADFQKANGLPASGVLSRRTIAALSGGQPSRLENEILANMESWRWMPRDMGESRIEVNIPDFTVSVTRDGHVVARNKVVVGKSDTPTPVFSNTMQFLIVNPYWNVPQSIIKKEMLPRLGQDPNYLHRLGYEVTWKNGRMSVRQPPGERNALGRIKFMFPNDYAVYLHDTPSRALFGANERAFSHGCVRVDQPFSFAEAVLGRDDGWSEQRVKKLIGGKERYVYLPKPLPIHIEYFTAFVDDTGRLELRDDVYGYSGRVKTALGLAN